MANRDGSGPSGKGPKTGRGLGNCTGPVKNTDKRPLKRGFGRACGPCGLGFGRGMRGNRGLGRFFGWNQSASQEDLKEYKKALEEEIEMVSDELKK